MTVQRSGVPVMVAFSTVAVVLAQTFCHFQFSVLPAPGRALAISTEWTVPGDRLGRVLKPRARAVVGVLFRRSGLAPGRYSCALRVGRTLVATVGARIPLVAHQGLDGTFVNLPENAEIRSGSYTFILTYSLDNKNVIGLKLIKAAP